MKIRIHFLFFAFLLLILSACNDNDGFKTNIVGNPVHTLENPYTAEEAAKNGDILVGTQENLERFYDFLRNVEEGKSDLIRVTYYTHEGAPIYHNLVFNERIEYTFDYTQDAYSGSNNSPDSIQSTYCSGLIQDDTEKEAYVLTGCEYEHISRNFRLVVSKN
ncbi:DUF4362 domain-containing protein [Anaerobacillus alkaliphilus]|nr:DUF4362 domain-containing protein [Anaerobacillus alkaliphilus]